MTKPAVFEINSGVGANTTEIKIHRGNRALTGISEILVLIFLLASVFILPRLLKHGSEPQPGRMRQLGAAARAGIVISIGYPGIAAMILRPWEGRFFLFFCTGLLPVLLAWALVWIMAGVKK